MKCSTRVVSKVPNDGELFCPICENWRARWDFGLRRNEAQYQSACKRCKALSRHGAGTKKQIQERLGVVSSLGSTLTHPNHPKRKPRKPKPAWTPKQKKWFAEEQTRKENEPGFVYLIGEENKHHAWKIGFSTEPECRLGDLQPGNPRKLHVVKKFEGTEQDEYALHQKFMRHNTLGEWFRCDPAILNEFIQREK